MRPLLVSFALAWALFTGSTAHAQEETKELSKPFSDYTLADLFPATIDERAVDIGKAFQEWGKAHRVVIEQRVSEIQGAITIKKGEIKDLKEKEKAAKAAKDLATAGALAGTVDAETVVVTGLEALADVTVAQLELADAMSAYGVAIEAWYVSDQAFRAHADAKFERGAGGLGREGKQHMDASTQATVDLSTTQDAMAAATKKVMTARVKFIKALQKGGIVAP